MDSKLPVAKRTRLGVDKILYERCLKERAKKSGAGAPVAECVNVDWEDDNDVEFSEVKGESSKSRKSEGKGKKGRKMEKICHSSDDDVVIMIDSSNDGDGAEDENLSEEEIDSDVMVVSVTDNKGEESVVVDDHVKEEVAELSDSSSSECENFYDEESDETYNEDSKSDEDDGLDDSSSCDKSEDEDEDDSSDDELKCGFWEKSHVRCKGKGRRAEGGEKRNKIGKSCYFVDDDDTDEENWTGKNGKNVARKNEERIVKSGLKKGIESCRIWERNDVKCKGKVGIAEAVQRGTKNDKRKHEHFEYRVNAKSEPEAKEVVLMLSSSDHGKCVKKYGGERLKHLKMATKMKAVENLERLQILADSLHGKGEAWKKFEKEKTKYKFWFKDEDEKPVEKSEFDKHLDDLFKELNMCLAFEQIGSTPSEVDNGDHCKTQTDSATLCSQGIHHLVLDEQIGIICKYCSHVNQEIRHILTTFSKPSSQTRRRGYFVQSGCPIYSDDFRYTGAGRHDSEIYNTTGTVWDLVPGTRRSMYEHQREGFEFIWKNLVGGIIIEELEKPLSSSGSGCIISHAPGTGKTRLTIIFLQSFMKLYPDSRPVIIAPKSMLLTWEEEFKKWNINIPFHNLNNLEFSGQENPAAVSVSKGRDSRGSETLIRLVKILSWKMEKSILGITYALFDKLVRDATKNADCTPIVEQMGKALLKLPSLLVLDEGHTPRNNQSSIYNSLLDVETERRIILSGTPFQNNFDELYNTLRLVNPKFDGEMKKNLRNISKELKSKWSGHKLRELKGMISPFVHVHKGKILQKSCPGLKDALIRLQPTDLQQELIGIMSSKDLKAGYLELSYVISLVSVHPSLLPKRYFQEPQFSTYRDKLEKLERDPYSGAKTKFVVELCRLSEALNEKVLIYSQYIDPLSFIKKQLQTYFRWTEGIEVLYMDGNIEAKQRQSLISSLNDPRSKVRVLLASIKACSEGIHLVGASRVVLLDVVWNPSVERQAISRAYRIGQKKMVYTYHLIGEEMDSKKFKVQIAKDRLSEIVFSSNDEDSSKENVPNIVCEDEILQKMFQHNDKLGGMFKQILYQPKESNLIDTFDLVAEEPN